MGTDSAPRSRLRVAIVTNAWTVGGGTERQLFLLLKGLDRQGFAPEVITLFGRDRGGLYVAAARELGIPVTQFRLTPRPSPSFAVECARLYRYVRGRRLDVVHCS